MEYLIISYIIKPLCNMFNNLVNRFFWFLDRKSERKYKYKDKADKRAYLERKDKREHYRDMEKNSNIMPPPPETIYHDTNR